jgi:hypothetical protein
LTYYRPRRGIEEFVKFRVADESSDFTSEGDIPTNDIYRSASQRWRVIPLYPSLPRLIKLASKGKALNRLEFSIFTYKGLGTSSGLTCPSTTEVGEVEELVAEERYAGTEAAGGEKIVVRCAWVRV